MFEKVLVVDDRETVRTDLPEHLRRDYKVTVAEDDQSALLMAQLAETSGESFDFAIVKLDLGYVRRKGIELAKLIARQTPAIKIVMLSEERDIGAYLDENLSPPHDHVWTGNPVTGYIDATINALRSLRDSHAQKKCFVIMPFSGTKTCKEHEWTDIFENLIKPGVESTGRYKCFRSTPLVGDVMVEIFDNLNGAEVVVADLTDQNGNVFYELGVRHSLRDAAVLIAQDSKDVPFDIKHNATIIYDRTEKGRRELKERLGNAMKQVADDIDAGRRGRIISPVRAYIRTLGGEREP